MTASDLKVAIVGAGAAGRCVAAGFAAAGAEVRVFDPDPDALAVLDLGVALELDRAGLDLAGADRVHPVASVEAAAAGVDIAFEAAPETAAARRAAVTALALAAPADAVIATTAGASPVGELAAALPGAGRIVGTLWWGTARPGGLVELVAAEPTSETTMGRAVALLGAGGRCVVRVRRDLPGALGNRLRHAMWREALALLDAGVCDEETIDAVVRSGFGARLEAVGPVENADLTGLDLAAAIHAYLLPHLDRSIAPRPEAWPR